MIVYYKPTYACNMKCSYCIVKNMDNIKKPDINDTIETLSNYPDGSHIIFHGGEPTLIEPEYYIEVIERLKNRRFTFSMQTNLMVKDIEKWIPVFKEMEIVSTSNDVVNTQRIGLDEVLWDRNIRKILDAMIPVQVIITLHRGNLFLESVKNFLVLYKDYGSLFSFRLNYIKPYVDRAKDLVFEEGLYGKMVIALDKFIREKGYKIIFSTIESYKNAIKQGISRECMLTSLCFNDYNMVDAEGSKYICSGLEEIGVKVPFVDRFFFLKENDCKDCKFFNYCQGGCVIDSITANNTPYSKTPYCLDNKIIFEYLLGEGNA